MAVYFVDPSTSAKVFARSFTIVSDKQINTVVPSISTGQIRVHVVTGGTDATVPAEAKQGFGIGNTIFYSDRVQLA
ncbi:hypothetical protein MB84_11705 [Pandoraea oxalativorans]|uniref:Uncharacterized protein n=1 Tax=Pandoraea oxalativorans TaxID=573737 RepID=A0A0E3YBC9_9BURK|nr:hypothetical protein MB84_11705 [Pandoraea oxalativorans]